jgi:hypothetical protein
LQEVTRRPDVIVQTYHGLRLSKLEPYYHHPFPALSMKILSSSHFVFSVAVFANSIYGREHHETNRFLPSNLPPKPGLALRSVLVKDSASVDVIAIVLHCSWMSASISLDCTYE